MDEATEPKVGAPPAPAGRSRMRAYLIDLVVITVGVLIALSLEGARQWMSDRALVREAEENLMLEIQENRDEIERVLSADSTRQEALESALRFADELLEDGSTEVTELNLGFSLAEVSSASWTTAERTGALAHMDYARVRELSRVYEAQDLFVAQQVQNLGRLASAMAMLTASDDPTASESEDLRAFRAAVLAFRAELYIQRQLAERVQALYDGAMGEAGSSAGR